jgi:hypothetical protein
LELGSIGLFVLGLTVLFFSHALQSSTVMSATDNRLDDDIMFYIYQIFSGTNKTHPVIVIFCCTGDDDRGQDLWEVGEVLNLRCIKAVDQLSDGPGVLDGLAAAPEGMPRVLVFQLVPDDRQDRVRELK